MKWYCCYVLDHEARVNAREIIEGSHTNEVFGKARGYLAEHPSTPAVEIWVEPICGKESPALAAISYGITRLLRCAPIGSWTREQRRQRRCDYAASPMSPQQSAPPYNDRFPASNRRAIKHPLPHSGVRRISVLFRIGLRNVPFLSMVGRGQQPRLISGMALMDAMADIVKYHGCLIIVHNGVTMDGKVLRSYEIFADSPGTVAAFAERAITRLHTIAETCDVVRVDPRLPDREYLVEMAKCEIDFVLEVAF